MRVSILIPTYNAEKTIRECLDSIIVQDFDDYETVLVDDGSTDNTLDIIKEYASKYDNIRYLENDHMGIAETLNFGLYECLDSDYTVRLDSDDIMAENRLKHQFQYMELHKDIDILGGGLKTFGKKEVTKQPKEEEMVYSSFNLIAEEDGVFHPTVIIRNSSIKKMDWFYSSYFNYAEDTEFWIRCQRNGLKVCKEPTIVTYYRLSEDQITSKRIDDMLLKVEWIKNVYFSDTTDKGEITAVINFKNEGVNVEKTLISIRATTKDMPIIVVNDGSDDGYDYDTVLNKYNITYIKNEKSLGAGQARALGASIVKTPYFVLLDGHMRFYTLHWDKVLKNTLKLHPKAIVCTDSLNLEANRYELFIRNEDGEKEDYMNNRLSPIVRFDERNEYVTQFQTKKNTSYNDIIEEIPVVLGATYAMSKEWWNYIHGYKGLQGWGYEEPLISIKTWLLGGKCLICHVPKIGHCYLTEKNYYFYTPNIEANRLYVAALFDNDFDNILLNVRKDLNEKTYDLVMEEFETFQDDLKEEKKYISDNQIRTIEWFKEFNERIKV